MDPDAHLQGGLASSGLEFRQARLHCERGAHGLDGIFLASLAAAEQRHDRIADVFLSSAAVSRDDIIQLRPDRVI
jgi:hypothetical protein